VPPRSQLLKSQPSQSSLRSQHTGMSESGLADAIVASSLASLCAPSPSKRNPAPPPPPHRRSRSRSFLRPNHSPKPSDSRTPSPPKGLRQTLRVESKSDDEAERIKKHNRRRIIQTHPNKHREGDRKRWRDQVTDRERKRYEGVWAANKGLLIADDTRSGVSKKSGQDMVLNLVVRDIWSRSRLHPTILEQIWNLVSHKAVGMLSREEFVVGMWLIDQSLKGRKLPVKVSTSVWASVQQISGLGIPGHQG